MRLLALETSDVSGSVALCEDGVVTAKRFLPTGRRSAQTLSPTIRSILTDSDWRSSDVECVATTIGPGSFTGLRVGVTTGKMFAWAVGANIIGVDTLDALATGLFRRESVSWEHPTVVSVGIDAQRGDAAVKSYLFASGETSLPVPLDERFCIVSLKKWLGEDVDAPFAEILDRNNREWLEGVFRQISIESREVLRSVKTRDVLFAGPVLRRVKDLPDVYPSRRFALRENWDPDAEGVAIASWARAKNHSFDDVWSISPIYSRLAAAEEKRASDLRTQNAR